MEEKELQRGCKGCIDHNGYSNCCDYIENHRRCRPVPAGPDGCVLKAADWVTQAALEKQHAWDRKQARKLLRAGENVKDVAEQVGASICSIGAMLNGRVPPEDPIPPTEPAPATWGDMVETPQRPKEIKKRGRNSVEKGTWHWEREEEFLPLYHAKMTDAEIGEKMGLAAKTIGIYRQKMGYPCIACKRPGKKMKGTRAEHGTAQKAPAREDTGPEGGGPCAEQSRAEQSRAEQSRAEQPPEEAVSMEHEEQGMSVAELAKVLNTAANGFDCPRVLLAPDGEPVRGCEVNIRYGADGRPERVTVLLT